MCFCLLTYRYTTMLNKCHYTGDTGLRGSVGEPGTKGTKGDQGNVVQYCM